MKILAIREVITTSEHEAEVIGELKSETLVTEPGKVGLFAPLTSVRSCGCSNSCPGGIHPDCEADVVTGIKSN